MLNSYVFSRKIDFNEDLSGKTRAFDTPAGEGVLGAVLLACCGRGGRVKGPASLGAGMLEGEEAGPEDRDRPLAIWDHAP